ncbi:glycosyl transferase [Marinomonas ushuaiensis DSM 15871]|uniref:Glycosyl transferase n=1 Tax=Marinomonas ushuaiensis DSM 15871 TaxID=1122207 RepID=X7EBU1_9GAMM|nr:glycosyltransferase family 2 protein [Marinomonas ushuaiensis]ETX12588.1 glycosyl transferase [Marinomonas ushuaiensis DSM 15871]
MKITIITVCFNSATTIRDTIESVKSQDYKNIEYIIVDGKSTDNTLDIINEYPEVVSVIISEKDNGLYDAMNKGIELATGDIIGILNSDDFYSYSTVLAEVSQTFRSNPEGDMVLGNVNFVTPDNLNKPVRFYSSYNFSPWKMRFGFMPAHPATFIKRSAYGKVGMYSLEYKIGADFNWFVRAFFLHKLRYAKLNKTLVTMREGGVSTAGISSYWLSSKEQVKALCSSGVRSNLLFILVRLPIKFFQKYFSK